MSVDPGPLGSTSRTAPLEEQVVNVNQRTPNTLPSLGSATSDAITVDTQYFGWND